MKPILKVKIAVDAAMTLAMLLLMKSHFVFYDFPEPITLFLLDYLAVMGLFVLDGNGLKRIACKGQK